MKKHLSLVAILASAPAVTAQTVQPTHLVFNNSADIGAELFLGYLPRENPTNIALQGDTWMETAGNWINIIRNGGMSQGSGYTLVVKETKISHRWMVTSPFKSWAGSTATVNQYGNRHHFGFRLYSKRTGVTFLMKDVTSVVRSYTYGTHSQGWRLDNVVNRSGRLDQLNYFRIRLAAGPDGINGTNDDVDTVQDANVPTTSCIYGGVGVAINAYGSGGEQQQLNNAVNYMDSNNLSLRFELDVPYSDNGTSKLAHFSCVLTADNFVPSPTLPAEVDLPFNWVDLPNGMIRFGDVGSSPETNGFYTFEYSNDLIVWNQFEMLNIGGGDITSFALPTGTTRNFFRATRVIPAYGDTTLAAHNAVRTLIAPPTADVVAP